MDLPNELWLKTFEDLPLQGLLASHCVSQLWRTLMPRIEGSIHLTLFSLAMKDIDERPDVAQPISLPARLACVAYTEIIHNVCIPDPLRTILTEWPSQRPPPGFCWPDAVINHATGKCLCRYSAASGESCQCSSWVLDNRLDIVKSLREKIRRHEPFDYHAEDADSRWELFSNPPRLHTDAQNEQTLRFIRMHPHDMWYDSGKHWTKLPVRCLVLYTCPTAGDSVPGRFCLVLEGPARGEIHAWASGWYQGFEAKSFLELHYKGWAEEDDTAVNEEEMDERSSEGVDV